MSKKQVKLAINIGDQDRQRFGLTDYDLPDLTEGRIINVDEKHLPHFVAHGWVAPTAATVFAAKTVEADDEESPVADTPVPAAVDMIGKMRSRDKLQHIVDNDPRASVKDAAKKRLASL